MRSNFKLLFFVKRNATKKNGNLPIIARITINQIVAQFNTQHRINLTSWTKRMYFKNIPSFIYLFTFAKNIVT